MDAEFAGKWLLLNPYLYALFAIFSAIPEALFANKYNAFLKEQQFDKLNTLDIMLSLLSVSIGLIFAMKLSSRLRRSAPWNAIITTIIFFMLVLSFALLSLLITQIDAYNHSGSNNFLPYWFASFSIVWLAIFCHLRFWHPDQQIDSCFSIGLGIVVFWITFSPFYIFLNKPPKMSSLHHQVASSYQAFVFKFGIFFLILTIHLFFSLKSLGQCLRKYKNKVKKKAFVQIFMN